MGSERIEELLDLFNNRAPLAQTMGMRLSFTNDGSAVVDLPYNPQLDHALGGIHGGVYATLLDSAGWFTAAALQECSCWMATSALNIHFLEAVQETSLRAIGRFIRHGKRQDVVEIHLYDDGQRLVGHAVGTFIPLPRVSLHADSEE